MDNNMVMTLVSFLSSLLIASKSMLGQHTPPPRTVLTPGKHNRLTTAMQQLYRLSKKQFITDSSDIWRY